MREYSAYILLCDLVYRGANLASCFKQGSTLYNGKYLVSFSKHAALEGKNKFSYTWLLIQRNVLRRHYTFWDRVPSIFCVHYATTSHRICAECVKISSSSLWISLSIVVLVI